MMTMDLSKCLGFRDSYLFYTKNTNIRRINGSMADKEVRVGKVYGNGEFCVL